MAVVTLSDPAAAECPVVSGQDCYRSPYSPEGYNECGSTWNTYSSEFSGPYADFPLPASDEEHLVPNSAGWTPWPPSSEYPHVPSGYACSPAAQPFVFSPATTSETAQQPLDAAVSSGVAPVYCFPPMHQGPFLPHFGFCGSGSGPSDEALPPPHTSADVSHMETTVPLEMTRSLMTASVALQSAYASAAEMNGYPSPVYIPSGSSGFLPNGATDTLPRPGSQSPEARISFDSPKFKLTQERALPLVRWYEEHKDHPYPSRQEKLHLCQTTQLTYTQVSTWFANARRRNKKRELGQGSTSSDEGEM